MTEEVALYVVDGVAEHPPLVSLAPIAHPGDGMSVDARSRLAQVARLEVSNAEEYQRGADILLGIKAKFAAVDKDRKFLKAPLDEAVKRVQDLFNPVLQLLTQAEGMVKGKLTAYDEQQRRLAAEEQRRAQAEADRVRREAEQRAADARRKAEEEAAAIRRRAEAEAAETRRLAQAEADEQRRLAQEALAAGRAAEAERLRAAAAERERLAALEAARTQEQAAAKADAKVERAEVRAQTHELTAQSSIAAVVAVATPKVAGLSRRESWKYRVTDPAKVNATFLMLDDKKIERTVQALHKEAEGLVGGIEVYSESALGARRGA